MEFAAFVVSFLGLTAGCAALWISLRGARAAERSATASEDSAQSAKMSAGAATRSAEAAERGLELDLRRAEAEEQHRSHGGGRARAARGRRAAARCAL
jgi:hypothetical protein